MKYSKSELRAIAQIERETAQFNASYIVRDLTESEREEYAQYDLSDVNAFDEIDVLETAH